VRVARTNETIEQRQEVVTELFHFIRDFFGLDTTTLVTRTLDDQKFLEAAEAVLQSAVGPWKSVDALRDFAVQALYGERPADRRLVDRARPGRVSPFSVPFALLRALAPGGQFDPRNLHSLSLAEAIDTRGLIGEENRWEVKPHGGETWLVTTVWARVIPKMLKATRIRFTNIGENRILHDGKLWALTVDAMPCFWWFPGYTLLEVLMTRQQLEDESPSTVLIAIEGWRYTTR